MGEEENEQMGSIPVSDLTRQFCHRRLAEWIECFNGADVYYLVQVIGFIESDLKSKGHETGITENDKVILKKAQLESNKVLSFLNTEDFNKIDINDPKYIAYQKALSNISLIQEDVYKVFFKTVSKVTLFHYAIPHSYLVEARRKNKGEDEPDHERRIGMMGRMPVE